MNKLALIRAREAQGIKAAPPRGALPAYPDAIQRELETFLRKLAEKAAALTWAALRGPLAALADEQRRQDDAATDAAGAILRARLEWQRWIEQVDISGVLAKVGEQMDLFADRAVKRQLPAVHGINQVAAEGVTGQALGEFTRQGVDLIKTIGAEHFDRIEQHIAQGFLDGRRHTSLAREIQRIGGVTRRRAEFIARDQVAKLNGKLQEQRQRALGGETYIWRTSKDSRVRTRHAELDGTVQRWDDPPIVDEKTGRRGHPGSDFQCLPPWSKVQFAPRAEVLYRRRYRGKLSLLVTDAGEALRCTPNHPVLTGRGWVAAQAVQEGDQLFHVAKDLVSSPGIDYDDGVATVGDVFEAAQVLGLPMAAAAGGDFHGDRSDGEVDVVSLDSPLPDDLDPLLSERACEFLLAWADSDLPEPEFAPKGLSTLCRLRLGASAARFVSGACKLLSFFGGHVLVPLEHRRAAIARLYAALEEEAADDAAGDLVLFREGLLAGAGEVLFGDRASVYLFAVVGRLGVAMDGGVDPSGAKSEAERPGIDSEALGDISEKHPSVKPLGCVVEKRIGEDFSGHVFNLQTALGWYQADGMIIHNCRCRAELDVDALLSALEAEDVPPAAAAAEVVHPLAALPQPMVAVETPAVMQFVDDPLGLRRPLPRA